MKKKIISIFSAMILGLTSSISMFPNTVYATETENTASSEENKNNEATHRDIEIQTQTVEIYEENTQHKNNINVKNAANSKEVSKRTKDTLLSINYANNATISNLLAPNRFSGVDKLNKKQEIAKRDNIPISRVTDEQVEKELKSENVQVMSYGESFSEIQNNIENVIQKIIENSTIEKGYTGDPNQYFINKITNNKEKLLLGLAYINRLYNFNIGSQNLKEILIYTPSYYGKQVDPLDWLIRIGGSGGEILKISNNTKAYLNLFKGTITDKESLLSFLEDNKNRFDPNTKMDEWFKKTSKAIIVEKASKTNPNATTALYSKLSSETNLQAHILPLLTLSENEIFVISNSATITYGLVDTYIDRSLKQNNETIYKEKIEQFKQQVEKVANEQNDFIEFWYRLGKPNVQPLLSTNRLVIDSLRIYSSGTANPSKEWSPKFGDNAAKGVKEFITPLNLYAQYFNAGGQAEGAHIRLFLAKVLEETGLSTYTHELTHHLINNVFLNNNKARDGLEPEFYPRGLFESYELNDPILNLNLIYDHKGIERFHNGSPERFKTEEDIQKYMKGLFDVIYTLDYAEANVILKRNNNDKQKWFHKLEQVNDTRKRINQGDPNATHKVDIVRKISSEEANELNTVYNLIDKNIIASRYEVQGLQTTGTVSSNGYYVIPLFSSNYAGIQNNNGVSGDIIMKRQAYELLAEYGYYDGLVPYISNQYKDEATKDGSVLSDEYILEKIFNNKYATMTDFKKEMFKERIDKKDQLKPISIVWKNKKVTISDFEKLNELMTEAIDSDLKNVQELPSGWNNIRAEHTQVELLKKEIFKAYLNDTNDFKESIYRDVSPTKKYTVIFDKNAPDVVGTMPTQNFELDIEQALNENKFTRSGYNFTGWKDKNGNLYRDNESVNNLVDKAGGSITLYAQWSPIQYQIHFNKNNPNATGTMENQVMIYDEEYQLNKNKFKLKGYNFKGWSITANGEVTYIDQENVSKLTTDPLKPIDLYAVWEKNKEVTATSSAMKAYFNAKGDLYINATFTEKKLGLATFKKYAKLIDSTTNQEVEGIKVTTQNFKEPEFNKFQIGIRKEMLDKLADGSYKLVLNAEVNGKKYEATLGTIPNINVSTPMEDKTISVDAIKGQDLVVSKAPLQIKEATVGIKNTYFNKSSNNFIVDGTFDIDVTADKQFTKTAVIIDADTNQPVDGIAPIKLGNFADIKFSKFQLIVPTSVLAQLEDGTYKIKVSGFTNKTKYDGVVKSTKQYNFQNDKVVNGKRISVTTLEDGTLQFSKGNIN
ncbi:ZmpA/ZmpB/ZmpC family metallo-endopeptidase (plasmid) [Clostridium perfringens]